MVDTVRVFASRRDRWRALLAGLAVVVLFVALYVGVRRHAPFLLDEAELREWIDGFGALAPLVFVVVQTLQVVVAPIPGQVLALVGGYLFGSVAGTVYSVTGVMLGSAIAFSLADRYGRPFVESVMHEDMLSRFDGFVDRVGIPGLVVFVLIPGLPDDAVCFLSGLTHWSLRTFLVVIAVGRLPAYVLTVYAGGQLASGDFLTGIALVALVGALSVVGYTNQQRIRNAVERLSPRRRS